MSLRATDVHVSIRHKTLLRSISVELVPGEFTALVGPNGAGKSTLVRCLSGILPPSLGTIELNGVSVSKVHPTQRAKELAYLPQQLEAPFAFTVAELLQLNSTGFDKAHPALALLELHPLLDQPLNLLSGGERQRAAIARTLLSEAPCLLLDEPLTHLDPKFALRLLEYLVLLARKGKSIVAVLHDLRLARRFATNFWLIDNGELVFSGAGSKLEDAFLKKVFGLNQADLLIFS